MDLNNSVTIRITVAAAVLKLFSVFFIVKLGNLNEGGHETL